MSVLRVLSHKGDEKRTWSLAAVKAGDPEAEAAVREAERIFTEARAAGASAYVMENGRAKTRIVVFDPSAAFILLAPAVVGG
jgi:hypothetical protein